MKKKSFNVVMLATVALFIACVVQAQTEIVHEHTAYCEHRELTPQEKDARRQHLKSFSQKGTRVLIYINCLDYSNFKQSFLNELGSKNIWRIVNNPNDADFILKVQAWSCPQVAAFVCNSYLLVFDNKENLLWKSEICIGHPTGFNGYNEIKDCIKKMINDELLKKLPKSDAINSNDILGINKVSEEKYELAENSYWQAIDYFTQYNYKKSIEMFSKAILLNPYHALAYKCRALAYYNLNKYKDAMNDIVKAMKLDPLCQQNDTIYHGIMIGKNDKFMRIWGPGGTMDMINNSLMAFSSSLNSTTATNNLGATPPSATVTTSSSSNTVGLRKVSCSFCNGTGMNPSKERPAFYSYSSEDYSSGMCNICGSNTNHYHKPCPSCLGKGYRETIAPNK